MEQIHKQILVVSPYQQEVKVRKQRASRYPGLCPSTFIVTAKEEDSFSFYKVGETKRTSFYRASVTAPLQTDKATQQLKRHYEAMER